MKVKLLKPGRLTGVIPPIDGWKTGRYRVPDNCPRMVECDRCHERDWCIAVAKPLVTELNWKSFVFMPVHSKTMYVCDWCYLAHGWEKKR